MKLPIASPGTGRDSSLRRRKGRRRQKGRSRSASEAVPRSKNQNDHLFHAKSHSLLLMIAQALSQCIECSRQQIYMQADGSFTVLKKEVENANSAAISNLQEVTISIQRESSTAVTHRAVIGKREFSQHLEAVLLQMHQGDRWQLLSSDKVAYTVEVIELGKIVDSKDHLEAADALKLEGNAFIKQKENRKAAQKYQEAYNLVVNDPTTKAQELKLSLISNLALACLNLSEFREAINWCNQHLEETLQPNLKIIYRKASANKGAKNWSQARKDIDFGIANSSSDAQSLQNFKKLLLMLQKQQREQQKKEKKVYGKMFG